MSPDKEYLVEVHQMCGCARDGHTNWLDSAVEQHLPVVQLCCISQTVQHRTSDANPKCSLQAEALSSVTLAAPTSELVDQKDL